MMTKAPSKDFGYDLPTDQHLKQLLTKQKTLNLCDIYEEHKKMYGVEVEFEVYETILNSFFGNMREEILEKQYTYQLPYNLGYMNLQKLDFKVSYDGDGNIKNYGTTYPLNMQYVNEQRRQGVKMPRHRFKLNYTAGYKVRWIKSSFKNRGFYYYEPSALIRKRQFEKYETRELR